MEKTQSLFEDFGPVHYAEWLQKVQIDLKGEHPNSLIWNTADNITIQPYYDGSNSPNPLFPQWKGEAGWTIFESIHVINDEEANRRALDVLNHGVSGLNFYLKADTNLEVLLRDILIEHIPINFIADGNATEKAQQFLELAKSRNLSTEQLKGSFYYDVIGNLAASGNYYKQAASNDFAALAALQELDLPHVKTLCVDGSVYQNAGATPAQELGAILAHAHEYLVRFGKSSANSFWFRLAVGSEFFIEIAKLRALRKLWEQLLRHYDIPPEDVLPQIHTQNSLRNKSIYDPWINMLRSTTETMSAIIGNTNEMEVLPFDTTFRFPGYFGKRIARNQQLLLEYESYLSKVADPGAGSYFIESLTEQLAEKGWKAFQEIEAEGGILSSLHAGKLQKRIQQQAENQQALFDNGKLHLIGVNKFEKKDEKMAEKIDRPIVKEAEKFTAIRPLLAIRLAEKTELERLQLEQYKA